MFRSPSSLATLLAALSLAALAAPGCSGGSAVIDEAEAPAASAEPDMLAADPANAPADARASPASSATPATSAAPATSATPTSGTKKDAGASCNAAADCASGVCEGEGCGAGEGKCAAEERRCTMDLRQYCGCDGKTFSGGGNCPRNRYAKKGPCEGDPGPGLKRPAPLKKP